MVTLTISPPAHRMPPATTWSLHGSAQLRCRRRVPVAAEQRLALHDRQAEHRVERHREQHQQRARRVRPAAGQRVQPEQRPEEQAAGHDEVHVDQLVQPGVLQGQPVQAGEVEHERVGDEDAERDQREASGPGRPGCAATASRRLRGRAGSVRRARVTGAPRARKIGATMDSTMCWTMCTDSSVVVVRLDAR